MKKTTLIIVAAVVALLDFYVISTYNSFATASEEVDGAWSNVEAQYQRRADLIPNLVNTVKGYAAHESQTFESVVSARAAATSLNFNGSEMTADQFKHFVDLQDEVTTALGRLIAISENYPELKANQNFMELQAQLEGTENRITVERQRYNDVVKSFNKKVVKFPKNIIASMFGFSKREFFAAQQGAATAPVVEF